MSLDATTRPSFRSVLVVLIGLTAIIVRHQTIASRGEADDSQGVAIRAPKSAPLSPAEEALHRAPHSPGSPKAGSPNVYAATASGRFSPAVAGVPERVYVPNSESNTVDVIDLTTFRIVAHFPVGSYPQHVTRSWNLRWLYVDNTLGDFLTVIDPRTGRPTGRTIPVTDPYNLYFTPDGSEAIVVAESYRRLDFRTRTPGD